MSQHRLPGSSRVTRQLAGTRGLAELGTGYSSSQPDAMRIRMQSRHLGRVGLHVMGATRLTFEPGAIVAADSVLCGFVARGGVTLRGTDPALFAAGSVFFATGESSARFVITAPSTIVLISLSRAVLTAAGVEIPREHGELGTRSPLVGAALALSNACATAAADASELSERHLARALEELAVGIFLQSEGYGGADGISAIDPRAAAIEVIERHYADHDLTPRSVAAALSVSVRHLQRVFQAESETVAGTIRERRTRAAVDLLTDRTPGGPSLLEVAARTGFGSVGEMRRAVVLVTGSTPRALRTMSAGAA